MNSFNCGLTRMEVRRAERLHLPCNPVAVVICVFIQGVSHER